MMVNNMFTQRHANFLAVPLLTFTHSLIFSGKLLRIATVQNHRSC